MSPPSVPMRRWPIACTPIAIGLPGRAPKKRRAANAKEDGSKPVPTRIGPWQLRETTAPPPSRLLPFIRLRLVERPRHEPRDVAQFHPHQHVVFALRLRLGQRMADVAGIGDRLAADVEGDGTGLKALLGCRPVGIA